LVEAKGSFAKGSKWGNSLY